jgi:hypothetical protein
LRQVDATPTPSLAKNGVFVLTHTRQAGSYRNLGFSLFWTLYVKSVIGATGPWYETYASPVAGSTPIIDGVTAWDSFFPVGTEDRGLLVSLPCTSSPSVVPPATTSPRKIVLASLPKKEGEGSGEVSPREEMFVLFQSRALARYLLRDVWVKFEGRYECKATWEVGGVVREVRLKRALVGFGEDEDEDG